MIAMWSDDLPIEKKIILLEEELERVKRLIKKLDDRKKNKVKSSGVVYSGLLV